MEHFRVPSFVDFILSIYESEYISLAQSYVWVFKDATDSNGNEECHPNPIIKDNMYSKLRMNTLGKFLDRYNQL